MRRSFVKYGHAYRADSELKSMYQKERMTPRSGVWNPKIQTLEALKEAEDLIVNIDSLSNELFEQENIRDGVFRSEQREIIDDVLSSLTEREEKVLRLRFGLYDGDKRTFEEIGHVFNVTRERIREIEKKALQKMRHPTRSKDLQVALDLSPTKEDIEEHDKP